MAGGYCFGGRKAKFLVCFVVFNLFEMLFVMCFFKEWVLTKQARFLRLINHRNVYFEGLNHIFNKMFTKALDMF